MSAEAFFLPIDSGRGGQRFCLYHAPAADSARRAPGADPVRSVLVHVHALAEEMNKSRRMTALQARAFAAAGHAVLQIDLLGCGDSSGDFGDADWSRWTDDVTAAARWLQQRHPGAPLWLWGHRAGCLLATAAAARLETQCNFLLWQPAVSGKAVLQQLLRMKLAASLGGDRAAGGMDALRRQLAAGRAVDVAGYALSPRLAEGLEAATLSPPRAAGGRADWLEVSPRADAALLPATVGACAAWQKAGFQVRSQVVEGPAFWHSAEIEEAPALIDASLAAVATPPRSTAAREAVSA